MGKISELVNQQITKMLESAEWTSASPVHVNTLLQINEIENPDFETEIRKLMKEEIDHKEQLDKDAPKELTDPKTIDFGKMEEKDIGGMLGKVGIDPAQTANLLKMTGGQGGIGMMGKFGALAGLSAPFAISMMVQPITEAVINELQRPGGFMDKRVKIIAEEEAFAMLDRQTRQNTRIGDRRVIIQQFEGFRAGTGFASTDASRMIRENADRVLNAGLLDRAEGI